VNGDWAVLVIVFLLKTMFDVNRGVTMTVDCAILLSFFSTVTFVLVGSIKMLA
jgi:hypothetical protein